MKNQYQIEICVYNTESAVIAERSGADRVELCSGPLEGGTTPSAGLIKSVRKHVDIDLFVIIRPRGGDFCYTEQEFEIMREDILMAKAGGADGIVTGVLNPDGSVDVARTKELVALAAPLPVTFHRAFDVTSDPYQALEDVIDCGCVRILTSGQKQAAHEGLDMIRRINDKADGRIVILPGSGINPDNVLEIVSVSGVGECHFSAMHLEDGDMTYRDSDVSMSSTGSIPDNQVVRTNGTKVRECKKILDEKKQTLKVG